MSACRHCGKPATRWFLVLGERYYICPRCINAMLRWTKAVEQSTKEAVT